jgi:hypothetical protein
MGSPTGWLVAASHNCNVPSVLMLVSRFPSGLNATSNMLTSPPPSTAGSGLPTGWLVARFHNRAMPLPAIASTLP